jgi:hypothetical protein
VHFGGGTNLVQRSVVASTFKTGAAAAVTAATGDAAKAVTFDSTVLVAATALSATYANPIVAAPGITVSARHVTAIGNVIADASGAVLPIGASPIAVTFLDSIVRGARTATASSSAVAATITADSSRNSVADTAADAASLFVKPSALNYHLRADASAVIGKGQVTAGESATDIDGDPRSVAGVSDLGADEFVNKPPTAVLAAPAGVQRQGRPIAFDASKSSDPEAGSGGGIVAYHWSFGDGTTATTAAPTTTHAYTGTQSYSITVAVTDRQGATSAASSPVSVTILDGVPPTLTIGVPRVHQKIALYKTRRVKHKLVHTRNRRSVTFVGGASDNAGVGSVLLVLRPLALSHGQCRWFDGKSALKAGSCTAPVALTTSLLNGSWHYALPLKAKLPTGAYVLIAVPVDTSGLAGTPQTVTFTMQ